MICITVAVAHVANINAKGRWILSPVGFPSPAFTPARRGSIFACSPLKPYTDLTSLFLSLLHPPLQSSLRPGPQRNVYPSAASHGHRQTRHGSRSRSGACGFHGETERRAGQFGGSRMTAGNAGETGWIRGGSAAIQGTRFQHRQTAVPRTARAASSPCHRRRSTPSPAC